MKDEMAFGETRPAASPADCLNFKPTHARHLPLIIDRCV
jgi:hypothetical protein